MVFLFSRIHSDIINTQLRDFRFPLECALWGCWERGCTILSISESLARPSAEQGLASGVGRVVRCTWVLAPSLALSLAHPVWWGWGGPALLPVLCQKMSLTHSRLHGTTKAQNHTDTWTCTDRLLPCFSQQNASIWDFLQSSSSGKHSAWRWAGKSRGKEFKLKHHGEIRLHIFIYASISHAANVWQTETGIGKFSRSRSFYILWRKNTTHFFETNLTN